MIRQIFAAILMMALAGPVIAAPPENDADKIVALLDNTLSPLVEQQKIPGAVVAIVQQGKLPILRGYGYADVASKRVMNPNTTRVRIGSMSKSFTGLAIMQLVDEGKVDLNSDANRFLKTESIPARYGKPVTVLELLTHRAGFDGDISYVAVNEGQSTAISKGWMSRQMIRVNPPGHVFAYDNSAYAALGQIIKDQDGRPYEASIKARLFNPLGMMNALVGVDSRYTDNATCYQRIRNKFLPCPHQVLKDTYGAAGNSSLTAADAALYLQALLNGPAGNLRIKPETFAAFTNLDHRIAPGVPGDGLGVYEMGPAGSGVFGHSGGIRGGSTLSLVIPAKGIGVFVHVNSSDGADNRFNLSGMLDLVFSSYSSDDDFDAGSLASYELPAKIGSMFGKLPGLPATSNNCNEAALPGTYMPTRPITFAALAPRLLGRLALPEVHVVNVGSDKWMIDGKPYQRAAACFFTATDKGYADGNIAARVGFSTATNDMIVGGPHTLAGWRKLKWYESAKIVALPYLLSLLLLPFSLILTIRSDPVSRRALRTIGLSGLLLLICILLDMEFASKLAQDEGRIFPVILWRVGWHIAIIGLIVGVVQAWQALKSADAKIWRKIVIMLMALAAVLAILLSFYWGLIGTFTGNDFS
jgi:CubicO group peptidase (beta-lactamase class C family)